MTRIGLRAKQFVQFHNGLDKNDKKRQLSRNKRTFFSSLSIFYVTLPPYKTMEGLLNKGENPQTAGCQTDRKQNVGASAEMQTILTAEHHAASAVGVQQKRATEALTPQPPAERRWFVAVVKNLTEVSCAQGLEKAGIETYVPTETSVSETPTGKRRDRVRALVPARLFIHATEAERRQAVNTPYVIRFMTDIAGRPNHLGQRPLAVIPESQMQALQYMVFNATKPVSITEGSLLRGDKVRVLRGPLKGLEGIVERDTNGVSRIFITLDTFGCASTELDLESLEKVEQEVRN